MHYMAPKMSPVQVMLMWHVLDETSRGFICTIFYICSICFTCFSLCMTVFSGTYWMKAFTFVLLQQIYETPGNSFLGSLPYTVHPRLSPTFEYSPPRISPHLIAI